jgi:hypothetical protein
LAKKLAIHSPYWVQTVIESKVILDLHPVGTIAANYGHLYATLTEFHVEDHSITIVQFL